LHRLASFTYGPVRDATAGGFVLSRGRIVRYLAATTVVVFLLLALAFANVAVPALIRAVLGS